MKANTRYEFVTLDAIAHKYLFNKLCFRSTKFFLMHLENRQKVELDRNMKEFKEFVYSHYGQGGIEDIGATKEQIDLATIKVIEYCLEAGESDIQGVFSSDLNLIKDILLNDFDLNC